jgi:hypothetical protein
MMPVRVKTSLYKYYTCVYTNISFLFVIMFNHTIFAKQIDFTTSYFVILHGVSPIVITS